MRYFSTEPYYVTKRAHEHLVKVWGGATSSFVKFKILPPGENMTRVILQNNEPEIRILVILIVSFGNWKNRLRWKLVFLLTSFSILVFEITLWIRNDFNFGL